MLTQCRSKMPRKRIKFLDYSNFGEFFRSTQQEIIVLSTSLKNSLKFLRIGARLKSWNFFFAWKNHFLLLQFFSQVSKISCCKTCRNAKSFVNLRCFQKINLLSWNRLFKMHFCLEIFSKICFEIDFLKYAWNIVYELNFKPAGTLFFCFLLHLTYDPRRFPANLTTSFIKTKRELFLFGIWEEFKKL